MKRIITYLFITLVAISSIGLRAQSFDAILAKWTSDQDLKGASIGFHVLDVSNHSTISSYQSDLAMVPASTQKLLTTAAALKTFSPSHQFETFLYYTGTIQNGVLNGSLQLVGNGDPSFGSHYHEGLEVVMEKLVQAVQKAGIDKINGNVLVADAFGQSTEIPRTWIWEDMGNYFGASQSRLVINDNRYSVFLKSGEVEQLTEILRVEPEIEGMTFVNQVVGSISNRDNAYIFGGPNQMEKVIKGSIPQHRSAFEIKGSMPNPELFAAQHLKKSLDKNGIQVTGEAKLYSQLSDEEMPRKGSILIHSEKGLTVSQMVFLTNQHSLNHYAEQLAIKVGEAKYLEFNREVGIRGVEDVLKELGISQPGLFIVDGSGLSRFNAISASNLTELLYQMKDNRDFRKSLPVAGESGTLSNMLKTGPAKGNLTAKSGYMERVRTYAGYVKTASGKEVAFALLVNNYGCTASEMKKKMEVLMDQLSKI
ncbi:MAG: D-alanyl-D-alanine carboxypeptidase/D-alanyl-D-alanine-endopeptidase [Flavobacteriales bacterium]|nr:D-alanyl-D-alanine carboxypeptidase/D-alanyl-D-alanine-endopeptidase [Flavobacteriales bacterium]